MKRAIIAISCFLLPSKLAILILRMFHQKVSFKAKIGFSVLIIDRIELGSNAVIGNFNFIKCLNLAMKDSSYIFHGNVIKGPFDITIDELSGFGNKNHVTRGALDLAPRSLLTIGRMSKFTSNHRLDLTRSITLGDYTTFAGSDSQVWTHGYYHYPEGPGRIRIDGAVVVGNNVYVGARVVINAGVKIADAVTVGSNACVSRSLLEKGMYVSQPLRMLPVDHDGMLSKFKKDTTPGLSEQVYLKDL